MHYVRDTWHINRIARVTGIDIVDAATQRKDADAGEGRGGGLLYNHAQGNCSAWGVVICSDQVSIAVVVIVPGIDGIGECKATDDRLRTGQRPGRVSHKCAVADTLIDQSAGAASRDNIRNSIAINIGKMRIGWNIGKVSNGCLEGAISLAEKYKEAIANLGRSRLIDGGGHNVRLIVGVGIACGQEFAYLGR